MPGILNSTAQDFYSTLSALGSLHSAIRALHLNHALFRTQLVVAALSGPLTQLRGLHGSPLIL